MHPIFFVSLFVFTLQCTEAQIVAKQDSKQLGSKRNSQGDVPPYSWSNWFVERVSSGLASLDGNWEAWALFSQGGFHGAGSGHTIVLLKKNEKKGIVFRIEPNHLPQKKEDKISIKTIEISSVQISRFRQEEKSFIQESHRNGAFDSYHYDLNYFTFEGKKLISFKKLLTMDDPFIGKKSIAHQRIMKIFQSIAEAENGSDQQY